MFKEMYYWLVFYLRKVKTNRRPESNAVYIISVLQLLNIAVFIRIGSYFLHFENKNLSAPYFLSLSFVLYFVNYRGLYKKKEDHFKVYETFTEHRKANGKLFFWIYVVLTFVIFFILTANLTPMNH